MLTHTNHPTFQTLISPSRPSPPIPPNYLYTHESLLITRTEDRFVHRSERAKIQQYSKSTRILRHEAFHKVNVSEGRWSGDKEQFLSRENEKGGWRRSEKGGVSEEGAKVVATLFLKLSWDVHDHIKKLLWINRNSWKDIIVDISNDMVC